MALDLAGAKPQGRIISSIFLIFFTVSFIYVSITLAQFNSLKSDINTYEKKIANDKSSLEKIIQQNSETTSTICNNIVVSKMIELNDYENDSIKKHLLIEKWIKMKLKEFLNKLLKVLHIVILKI